MPDTPNDPTRTNPPEAVTLTTPIPADPPGTLTGAPPPAPDRPGTLSNSGGPLPPADPGELVAPPGYEIQGELGRGGMGAVYKARQVNLNRTVALKVVLGGGRVAVARFWAEAEVVAAVRHPNVVGVYEFGEHAGRPHMAMEFCPGGSLAERPKPLPPREAAALVEKIARGVAAAHAEGIVHRDLKPGNVLFDAAGEPKVADFGLAKRTAVDLTNTQAVMGTPAYMAPEQAEGRTKFAGPPADVWALGVILQELVTGKRPFDGDSAQAIMFRIMSTQPPSLRTLVRNVPRDLETVVAKCLTKGPELRYATAADLADDLARFARGEPIAARRAGVVERAARWARRKPAVAAAWALVVVVVAVGTFAATTAALWRGAEDARHRAVAELVSESEAKEKAETAQRETEVARNREAKAKHDVIFLNYASSVELAYKHRLAGQFERARNLLANTPVELRGWEWGYVHRLCHQNLVTLDGHNSNVLSAVFSPDGRRVMTGTAHGVVRWWDVLSGKELRSSKGRADVVVSVAFSPDGRRAVTGHIDKTARVWNVETGAEEAVIRSHSAVVTASFSRDGREVITASGDRTAQVWVPDGRAKSAPLRGYSGRVGEVRFSADGRRVVTQSIEGDDQVKVKLWDVNAGEQRAVLTGHPRVLSLASFSADGRRVTTASGDSTARVWNAETGAQFAALQGHTGEVLSVELSADGKRVVTGSKDGTARVWDADTGVQITVLEGHTAWVYSASFSPDGKLVVTGSGDGTARVWEVEATPVDSETTPSGICSASFSPDGTMVAMVALANFAQVCDVSTGKERAFLSGRGHWIKSVLFSPDGTRVLGVCEAQDDECVGRVWDAETGRELATLLGLSDTSASFSPDGKRVVGLWDRTRIQVWDVDSGKPVAVLTKPGERWNFVSFTRDGARVATESSDGTVKFWDTDTGHEVPAEGVAGKAWSLSISPDGRRTIRTERENVQVRDTDTDTLMMNFWLPGLVVDAVFSRDGTRVLVVYRSAIDDRAFPVQVFDAAPANYNYKSRRIAPPPRPKP